MPAVLFFGQEGSTIEGSCTVEGCEKGVEILELNFGLVRAVNSQAGTSQDRVHSICQSNGFTVSKVMDASDSEFMKACATGKGVPAEIRIFKQGGSGAEIVSVLKFTDVLIESYHCSMSEGGFTIIDMTMKFTKIDASFTTHDSDDVVATKKHFDFDFTVGASQSA